MKKIIFKCFSKQFIKYFTILVFILIVTIPTYVQTIYSAKNSILISTEESANNELNYFIEQLAQAEIIANAIVEYDNFIVLNSLETVSSNDDNINKLQDKINIWTDDNSTLQNIYIMFGNNNTLVTSNISSNNYSNIYGTYLYYEGLSTIEWRETVFNSSLTNENYISDTNIYSYGEVSEKINGFTYFVNSNLSSSNYVISFVFDTSEITENFASADYENDIFLYIENLQGDVLVSHNYEASVGLGENIDENVSIDGIEYKQITVTNEENSYRIVIGININDFNSTVISAINPIFIILLLVGLLVTLLFISFISYKDAKKIKKLIHLSISQNNEQNERTEIKDEIDYIYNSLDNVLLNKTKYITDIKSKNDIAKSYILENMFVVGVNTEKEQEQALAILGNSFEKYCLIKIRTSSARIDLSLAIKTSLENYYKDSIFVTISKPDDITAILFLNENNKNDILDIANQFTSIIYYNDEKLHIGFSEIANGVKYVKQTYLESINACDYNVLNSTEIYTIYSKSVLLSNTNSFDFNLFTNFYALCTSNNNEDALKVFDKIKNSVYVNSINETQNLQTYFFLRQIIEVIIGTLDSSNLKYTHRFIIPEYSPTIPINELLNELREILVDIFTENDLVNNNKTYKKQNEVLQFIEENFSNNTLNAYMISEHFELSEKYVFTIVKNATGQTLNKHINDLRLTEAEKYLVKGGYSNKAIMELTGFGSEKSFYRAFEKKHGIAPQKWKSNTIASQK